MNESLFENAKVVDLFSELSVTDKINAKNRARITVAIFNKRYKLNMTHKEFADYIGLEESDIIRWENGDWDFNTDNLQILVDKIDFDIKSIELILL